MTMKGQDHAISMFGAHYLDNGWIYGLGCNEALIGNDTMDMKWSRDR